ncbi:MAG: hypothetical protein ACYS8W_12385 [Planctomycetota bacterium]|jgi:hypothetical protein
MAPKLQKGLPVKHGSNIILAILALVVAAGCGASEKKTEREYLGARGDYPTYRIEPEIRQAALDRERGIKHYQMAMRVRRNEDSIKHFREAAKLFRHALELYYSALHKYPDFQKRFVEHEIETVDEYIVRCMRHCPVGVNPLERLHEKTGPAIGLTPEEREMKAALEAKVRAAEAAQ